METGVGFIATHDAIGPDLLARLVEERGHESLFFAEHTHIPASRASPYPGGGDLPRKYAHTYDLFVALTAAAVVNTRLRLAAESASSLSVTPSSRLKKSPASTACRVGVSSSAWAQGGTARRW